MLAAQDARDGVAAASMPAHAIASAAASIDAAAMRTPYVTTAWKTMRPAVVPVWTVVAQQPAVGISTIDGNTIPSSAEAEPNFCWKRPTPSTRLPMIVSPGPGCGDHQRNFVFHPSSARPPA